jgi:hypothetical protein
MAQRSGLDAQLGLAEESTYGTYVAPARFLEFNTESMKLDIGRNSSMGRRAGQYIERSDHWRGGKRQAKGAIEFDIGNRGFGLLLTKHLLGTVTTSASGTGKKHSGSIGDLFGKSLTIQIGRPDIGGTVNPFSYLGCKIIDWEISSSPDGFATLKLGTIDARDETTAQALGSATAPAATEILHWSGAVITVGGSQLDASSVSFKGSNKSNVDRFLQNGTVLKKEPITNGFRDIGGAIQGEFENLTAYNRFVNGTEASIVATWTAVSTYDVALPYKLVITANARFDGDTPNTDGEAVLLQSLPFKVLDSGAASITIDYYTADATP